MNLTPLDIKKQEFKKTLRGYDPIEVESFLEMVAEQYESLIREKNGLADEALKLKTQLQDYQSVERTLQDTLVHAQESVKASRENSVREADSIIREAELRAERILEESKLKLTKLKNELVVIRSQKDSISRRLKHLLQSQIELLEVLELDDLGYRRYEQKEEEDDLVDEKTEEVEFGAVDEVMPSEASAENPQIKNTQNPETGGPKTHNDRPVMNRPHERQISHENNANQIESGEIEEPRGGHVDDKRARITDHLILD